MRVAKGLELVYEEGFFAYLSPRKDVVNYGCLRNNIICFAAGA
jgi:hypothetical protein